MAANLESDDQSQWSSGTAEQEFSYVPVSPWGPVALVLGIASLSALTNNIFGIWLAVISLAIGVSAVIRLLNVRGTFRGLGFAIAGASMSAVFLPVGYIKLMNAYENECPDGYQRISFSNDISDYQFVNYGGRRRLHPKVAPYIGQKIFLKGYMWNTMRPDGLTEFLFLKDNGECCFGGDPAAYDNMVVYLGKDEDGNQETTKAYNGMVAVAGVLNANVNATEDEPVYTLQATLVEEAWTSFDK